MDELLLFTPTKPSHFEKLEDLLKALCKKWTENFSKEVSIIQNLPSVHGQYNMY